MLIQENLTNQIIKAFYNVYHELGNGFLEKAYEYALCVELENVGLNCSSQVPIDVYYDEKVVGKYFADGLVANRVIVELKADPLQRNMNFNY